MPQRDAQVVVIGAGLAGLTAARELTKAGIDVVVIEARDRVGGRTLNHDLGEGKVVEVGGQWIGPTQDRIAALAAELGVETFPTYTAGRDLGPELPPDAIGDLAKLTELQAMADTIPLESPWTADLAHEWDAQTFHTWMTDRMKDPAAQAMVELMAGAIFTVPAAELSLLHVLIFIRSAGSLFPMLTDIEGGAQQDRFVAGSQRISELMAEQLAERVVLSSPVRSIAQGSDVFVASDRIEVHAKRCIVAVPPTVIDRIAFTPALPADRAQLQRRFAAGSVIKINAIYDEPFWRTEGLSGRIVDPSGPVTVTFDNSPPDGSPGVLMGFAEADEARRLLRMTPDDRRRLVLDYLATYFGPRAAQPIDYVEGRWDEEEWTRGCYGANLPPGTWTRYGHAIREPVGLVHWASAETAVRWINYMDGAVSSGERAAAEILAAGV